MFAAVVLFPDMLLESARLGKSVVVRSGTAQGSINEE